ncbi:MAG: M23 family metallopeptidase, partial [Desulforhopalus sp.]
LRIIVCISTVSLLFFLVTSIFSISLFTKNRTMSNELAVIQDTLEVNAENFAEQQRIYEEQNLKLSLKIAHLELNNLKEQTTAFYEEKEAVISNAVGELNERSQIIERIINSIGIKLPEIEIEVPENSGGLFIEQPEEKWDELLFRADKYLKTVRHLPIGNPIKGKITSRYGKRKDPLNNKLAFHSGVDLEGNKGEKIRATADGTVIKACRNGGHGNYVMIDHGNGYTTSFSHMKKFVVRKGDKVQRGQLIGYVGNSGRSTGPHLHYEIALDKKTVNPSKFIKVAKLIQSSTSSVEKK